VRPGIQPGELRLRDEAQSSSHTLFLIGELDLATAPSLAAELVRLCADGASEVILDLSELAFIDSTGLHTIVRGMELCQEHRCGFFLIPGRESVQRLFALTRLTDRLPFLG
jgi:anti-sigma B factor antagonist